MAKNNIVIFGLCLLLVAGIMVPTARAQAFSLSDIQNQISVIGQKIAQLFDFFNKKMDSTAVTVQPAAQDTQGNGTAPIQIATENKGCILKDGACCMGDKCAAADLSCSNGYFPFLDGCDASCQPIVKCEEPCVGEGESIYNNTSDKCCSGLTPADGNVIQYDTGECKNHDYYKLCLKCGDGVCSGPENNCNCSQDCKTNPGCAKEGEVFSDSSRHCCEGLQTDYSYKACSDGKVPCHILPIQITCKKPSSLSCNDACRTKGYAKGYCGGESGCKQTDEQMQESDIAEFGCMKLPQGTTENNLGQVSWSACCCSGVNAETCVKEGGIIDSGDMDSICCAGLSKTHTMAGSVCKDPKKNKDCAGNGELVYNATSMFGKTGGPQKCCDAEAGIRPEFFSDGGAAKGWCVKDWNKLCGNGKCDSSESALGCPWDCRSNSAGTCDDLCTSAGYGTGTCVTNSKCAAGETDMGTGIGRNDCSLYGLSKTTTKTCCCKAFNSAVNCLKEGEVFDRFDTSSTRHNWNCCAGLADVDLTQLADWNTGTVSGLFIDDNYRSASICVSSSNQGKLQCKKPANGKEGWYYSKSGALVAEVDCMTGQTESAASTTTQAGQSATQTVTACVVKNNGCDYGIGWATYNCSDKGGGTFVISGCDKSCQPYGKCVNANGNTVTIPQQK